MSARAHCVYCGASCIEPASGDAVCRHCRSIQRTVDYVPQWDPLFFVKVQNLLVFPPSGRPGDWVELHKELGCMHADVVVAVRRLRRHRWVIEGCQGKGYRLLPFGEQSVQVKLGGKSASSTR